eukprot:scaffold259099_cov35-Prasinocladus_malaysianus.AAC.5
MRLMVIIRTLHNVEDRELLRKTNDLGWMLIGAIKMSAAKCSRVFISSSLSFSSTARASPADSVQQRHGTGHARPPARHRAGVTCRAPGQVSAPGPYSYGVVKVCLRSSAAVPNQLNLA